MSTMKIIIDQGLCQGHGVCTAESPEVFELDDEGNLKLLREQISEPERESVRQAALYCPTSAITLEER